MSLSGDLEKTLWKLIGKIEFIIPALDKVEQFAGGTSGELKETKKELEMFRETVEKHMSKTESRLEDGSQKLFGLANIENHIGDMNKKVRELSSQIVAAGADISSLKTGHNNLERSVEGSSKWRQNIWLIILSAIASALLTTLGGYILLTLNRGL